MSDRKALAPGDAFFLLIESDNTPSSVGILARMKLPKGKDKTFILEMIEGFRKYQPSEEPYNLKLAKRSAFSPLYSWEKVDNVDIDYHLRHSALPQPGGERELAVLISRLHSIPLDHRRPMWELHVIEGLENDCFAIYAKMHHALIDGVAGSRLMAHWADQTKPGVMPEFLPFWAKPLPKKTNSAADDSKSESSTSDSSEVELSGNQGFAAQFMGVFHSVALVLKAVWSSVLGARSKSNTGLVAPYSAPDSILNAPVGPQRRVSTVEFNTERLKAVGKQRGGTLNDVVMTICGGALRRYLLELNALPATSLVAQVPVSFRPKGEVGGGNAIGMLLASLGTDEEDTLTRFDKVIASMSAGKALLSKMNAKQITAYSALMTLPFVIGQMTRIGNRRRNPMYNVVISNVPGPRETRYLNGAEIFSVHPVSFVMQGQALNITLYTYADKITFVFTACRESLPNVQHLVGHTRDALDELEKALDSKSP